jgi:hypothetical protein
MATADDDTLLFTTWQGLDVDDVDYVTDNQKRKPQQLQHISAGSVRRRHRQINEQWKSRQLTAAPTASTASAYGRRGGGRVQLSAVGQHRLAEALAIRRQVDERRARDVGAAVAKQQRVDLRVNPTRVVHERRFVPLPFNFTTDRIATDDRCNRSGDGYDYGVGYQVNGVSPPTTAVRKGNGHMLRAAGDKMTASQEARDFANGKSRRAFRDAREQHQRLTPRVTVTPYVDTLRHYMRGRYQQLPETKLMSVPRSKERGTIFTHTVVQAARNRENAKTRARARGERL